MALNFQQLGLLQKAKSLLNTFQAEHPKFALFLGAVHREGALRKDSVIEISVTPPEGQSYTANIRITDNDLALLQMLRELREGQGHGNFTPPT